MDIEAPRVLRLRLLLGESQQEFAKRLLISQPTVFRLENGQAESGPQRLLLDALEREIAEGRVRPKAAHTQPDDDNAPNRQQPERRAPQEA
jgi:transcriptional regulator with XRE-family HTH domain